MPSGLRYWTVVDEGLLPVAAADRFLRDERFGRDRAELTTKAHAGGVLLYLSWCARTGRDWRTAAADMAAFIVWLRYVPVDHRLDPVVAVGPGARPVRQARRINRVLSAVRLFLGSAAAYKDVPASIIGLLYEIGDVRDLPVDAHAEDGEVLFRMAARHHLAEDNVAVDRAADAEVVALLQACLSARDRFIIVLLARVGLRRGELTGLRLQDVHFMADSRELGCPVSGSHLHVVRRANVNGAWAKSRHRRTMPVDFLVVHAGDQYAHERMRCSRAAASDFLMVNLFKQPLGAAMRPDALNELVEALSRRAGLDRVLSPHMLRHAYASNVADAGGSLDEIQALLGQSSPYSAQPYLHPSADRLRAAVQRVATPRAWDLEEGR
jgi:site-specific recombinase XerD